MKAAEGSVYEAKRRMRCFEEESIEIPTDETIESSEFDRCQAMSVPRGDMVVLVRESSVMAGLTE